MVLVADAKSKLDESIQSIVELIEEVRAVGGDKAYHIPVIFKMVVERALDKRGFRAESGSLMYLSKKPHYISEEVIRLIRHTFLRTFSPCGLSITFL